MSGREAETTMTWQGATSQDGTSSAHAAELHRLPLDSDVTLRAWDGADMYVLTELAERGITGGRWLIVNDLFGALAVGLAEHQPQSWNDSLSSHAAAAANLERNGIDQSKLTAVATTAEPVGPIDVAVIKIPRSLALLEDQLRRLRPRLHEGSIIIGAGMVKSIHLSTIKLFETIIGPSPTSYAKKKARLINASFDPDLEVPVDRVADLVTGGPATYELPSGRPVVELANVFSRGRLDHGTRALLEHLPTLEAGAHVLDLGCGNGLLGLHVADRARGNLGSLTFVDESYQAVASAKLTADAWAIDSPTTFVVARTLDTIEDGSVDLVVNNPPFHTQQSRSDSVALTMFDDARRVLAPGGRLIVVGNRHLGYQGELKRRFSAVRTVGSTAKFVILEATRS